MGARSQHTCRLLQACVLRSEHECRRKQRSKHTNFFWECQTNSQACGNSKIGQHPSRRKLGMNKAWIWPPNQFHNICHFYSWQMAQQFLPKSSINIPVCFLPLVLMLILSCFHLADEFSLAVLFNHGFYRVKPRFCFVWFCAFVCNMYSHSLDLILFWFSFCGQINFAFICGDRKWFREISDRDTWTLRKHCIFTVEKTLWLLDEEIIWNFGEIWFENSPQDTLVKWARRDVKTGKGTRSKSFWLLSLTRYKCSCFAFSDVPFQPNVMCLKYFAWQLQQFTYNLHILCKNTSCHWTNNLLIQWEEPRSLSFAFWPN